MLSSDSERKLKKKWDSYSVVYNIMHGPILSPQCLEFTQINLQSNTCCFKDPK